MDKVRECLLAKGIHVQVGTYQFHHLGQSFAYPNALPVGLGGLLELAAHIHQRLSQHIRLGNPAQLGFQVAFRYFIGKQYFLVDGLGQVTERMGNAGQFILAFRFLVHHNDASRSHALQRILNLGDTVDDVCPEKAHGQPAKAQHHGNDDEQGGAHFAVEQYSPVHSFTWHERDCPPPVAFVRVGSLGGGPACHVIAVGALRIQKRHIRVILGCCRFLHFDTLGNQRRVGRINDFAGGAGKQHVGFLSVFEQFLFRRRADVARNLLPTGKVVPHPQHLAVLIADGRGKTESVAIAAIYAGHFGVGGEIRIPRTALRPRPGYAGPEPSLAREVLP